MVTGSALILALAAGAAFAVTYNRAAVQTAERLRALPPTPAAPTAALRQPLPLTAVASDSLSRIVTVETQASDHEELGTGWLFDAKGDFVTNAHVIEGQLTVRINDRRGQSHLAAILGVDREQDIALLRSADGFQGQPLTAAPPIDPPLPEDVVILASARATGHGEKTDATIARLHQDVPVGNADVDPNDTTTTVYHDMMALRAQVFPGNSGGPVLDSFEHVVGIVTLASRSAPQAFAIPLPRVLDELQAFAARATP